MTDGPSAPASAGATPGSSTATTVSRWTLAALVVGSIVGGGVFSLPQEFASSAGATGAILAWVLAGTGTLLIALTFLRLADRRPDLDAGVYSYAREGFGRYPGFLSAMGYYLTAVIGNVAYWVLIMSTLGEWVPALGDGSTPLAVGIASLGVWTYHLMLRRGITSATAINRIVTVAKLVPLAAFLFIAFAVFDVGIFLDNLDGGGVPVPEQVRGAMLVTVFVFIGIEGASVYSRFARRRLDIGWATVVGFLGTLALFVMVTLAPYGILTQAELAALSQPSVSGVLEAAVGTWGAVLVGAGLLISVLGAYLAWTLMGAEVMVQAAKQGDVPAFFLKENSRGAPIGAITATNVLVQLFLLVVLFATDAFNTALSLISSLILIPYVLSAGFAVRTAWRGMRDGAARPWWFVVSVLTLGYALFIVWAGGVDYLLLTFAIYAPASVVHVVSRGGWGTLRTAERIELLVACALGVAAYVLLATGAITL